MSDPSNPFKSLADSLLSGTEPDTDEPSADLQPPSAALSLGERIEAFFSAELLHTRLAELASIGSLEDPQANEFIYAAAEEDPDPLIRIAAMVQLLRRKTVDDTEPLLTLLAEEAENPRVYSLGLMLIEELPEPLLEHAVKALEGAIPDEAVNCAALIQLIRETHPERLPAILESCIDSLDGDLEALDEEVWDEMVLSLASEASELTTVKNLVRAGLDKLADDHPRRLEFT